MLPPRFPLCPVGGLPHDGQMAKGIRDFTAGQDGIGLFAVEVSGIEAAAWLSAVQADARVRTCGVCHRPVRDDASVASGIGPCCAAALGREAWVEGRRALRLKRLKRRRAMRIVAAHEEREESAA